MKIEMVPVELNGIVRNLIYDLSAHYDLEKRFGSQENVLEEINKKSIDSMRYILQAGFAHEEEIPIEKLQLLVDLSNIDYLTVIVLQALKSQMPSSDKQIPASNPIAHDVEGLPWDWMYYTGTVLLGMSEAVFWRTTLKKFFALWEVHKKYNGLVPESDAQATSSTAQTWVDQYI